MSYRNQSFRQRFASMGDEAEGVYLEIQPLGKTQRLGWRRPDVSMKRMGETLRHMPDFYADSGHLVEVVGLGRDGILKIKVSKWEALKVWQKIAPVTLFVWNSSEKAWVLLGWEDSKKLIAKARAKGIEAFENDGNEYFPVEWAWIVATASYVGSYE